MTHEEIRKLILAREKIDIDDEYQSLYILSQKFTNNGYKIKYINNPSIILCEAAVSTCPNALKYIKHQTPSICMIAIKNQDNKSDVLRYVQRQTQELCNESVKRNISSFKYVDKEFQTKEMVEYIINSTSENSTKLGFAVDNEDIFEDKKLLEAYIKYNCANIYVISDELLEKSVLHDTKLCESIMEQYPEFFDNFYNRMTQTQKICNRAVLHNYRNFGKCLPEFQTKRLTRIAIDYSITMIVDKQNPEYADYKYIMKKYPSHTDLSILSNICKNEDILIEIINKDSLCFTSIPKNHLTPKICKHAVKVKPSLIKYIDDITMLEDKGE